MSRTHCNLYTKRQIQALFQSWQCSEPIPKKGRKVLIAWAGKSDVDVDLIEIEPTPLIGTYGDKLFKATFSSRAGRQFEQVVQEAHVIAFRMHLAAARRQENLARNKAVEQLVKQAGDDAFRAIDSVKDALGCDSAQAVRRVASRP